MKLRIIDNLNGTVEPLSLEEAEWVGAFIRRNTAATNRGEYSPNELERLCAYTAPEQLRKEVDSGYLILLLTDEDELAGCALVVRRGTRLVIKTIQVSVERGRQGYGTLLYKQCEKRFREEELDEIDVDVTKFPQAEAFYRKHGFVRTGNPTHRALYFAMFKYIQPF